jgi:hypothetical protein
MCFLFFFLVLSIYFIYARAATVDRKEASRNWPVSIYIYGFINVLYLEASTIFQPDTPTHTHTPIFRKEYKFVLYKGRYIDLRDIDF